MQKVRTRGTSANSYTGKDFPFDLTTLLKVGDNHLKIYQLGCACVSGS